MTYRPPAESAALDQARAFIREEASREKVAILIAERDQKFCAGAMFAFGAVLARIMEVDKVDPLSSAVGEQNVQVLSVVHELVDGWKHLMERRHGA